MRDGAGVNGQGTIVGHQDAKLWWQWNIQNVAVWKLRYCHISTLKNPTRLSGVLFNENWVTYHRRHLLC